MGLLFLYGVRSAELSCLHPWILVWSNSMMDLLVNFAVQITGVDPGGGPGGLGPPTTKNEAPAPKFYKIEASECQL